MTQRRVFGSTISKLLFSLFIPLLCIILLLQGINFLLHSSPHYQQLFKDLVQDKTGFSLNFEELGLNWGRGGTLIQMDNVSFRQDVLSMEAQEMQLGLTLFSYLRGGSLVTLKIREGNLIMDDTSLPSGDLSSLQVDIQLTDIIIRFKNNPRVKAVMNTVQLRQQNEKIFIHLRGQFTADSYIETDINFTAELAEQGVQLFYMDLSNILVSVGWQDTAKNLGLSADILKPLSSLQALRGDIQLWGNITSQREGTLIINASLPEAEIHVAKPLVLEDIYLVSRFRNLRDSFHLLDIQEASFIFAEESFSFKDVRMSKENETYESYIPLLESAPFASLIVYFIRNDFIREQILGRNVHGNLYDTRIQLNLAAQREGPLFRMDAKLDDIAFSPYLRTFGGDGIDGRIHIEDNKGWLFLDADECSLFVHTLYTEPFYFDGAQGIFVWEWLPEEEMVLVGEVNGIRFGDQSAAMKLSLHLVPDHHIYLDLVIGLRDITILQSHKYLPDKLMPKNVFSWAQEALRQGGISQAALSIKGDMKNFEHPAVQFELLLDAQDVIFKHTKSMNPLVAKQAYVVMSKQNIHASLPQGGSIQGIVDMTQTEILFNMISTDLRIQGTGFFPATAVPGLLKTYTTAGPEFLDGWRIGGRLDGAWGIHYSIKEKELRDIYFRLDVADGFVQPPFVMNAFENIRGFISFSFASGYGGEMTARFVRESIRARFVREQDRNYLELLGYVSHTSYIPSFLADFIDGKGLLRMRLYTASVGEIAFNEVDVNSSLVGTQLKFPSPLNKNINQAMPVFYGFNFDKSNQRHKLSVDNVGEVVWRTEGGILKGLSLNLSPSPQEEGTGLRIYSELDELNITAWLEVLQRRRDKDSLRYPAQAFSTLVIMQKDLPQWQVAAKKIQWQERSYEDLFVRYDGSRDSRILFATRRLEGFFEFDEERNVLAVNISRLNLVDGEQADLDYADNLRLPDNLSFTGMPRILISVPQFNYEDRFSGDINLEMNFSDKSMYTNIVGNLADLPFRGYFSWEMPTSSSSILTFNVSTDGSLTEPLGILFSSNRTEISLHLQWTGRNEELARWKEKTSGTFLLDMEDGFIAGRQTNILDNLFKILSLKGLGRLFIGGRSGNIATERVGFSTIYMDARIGDGRASIVDEGRADFLFSQLSFTGYYDMVDDNITSQVVVTSPVTELLPVTALLLGASALVPLLITLDFTSRDYFAQLSSAVYSVEGDRKEPKIALRRIGYADGGEITPERLSRQLNIRKNLRNFRF